MKKLYFKKDEKILKTLFPESQDALTTKKKIPPLGGIL
jgi:hypothetical protein